jgi:hypothetical protein
VPEPAVGFGERAALGGGGAEVTEVAVDQREAVAQPGGEVAERGGGAGRRGGAGERGDVDVGQRREDPLEELSPEAAGGAGDRETRGTVGGRLGRQGGVARGQVARHVDVAERGQHHARESKRVGGGERLCEHAVGAPVDAGEELGREAAQAEEVVPAVGGRPSTRSWPAVRASAARARISALAPGQSVPMRITGRPS